MENAQRWLVAIYSSHWSAIFHRYCLDKFSRFTDPHQLMEDARQNLALALQRKIDQDADTPLSEGYIVVAFRNAVTDVHRQRSGRGEPRAWLKAFGELGRHLFELYCLARLRRSEIHATLQSEPEPMRQSLTREQANQLLDQIDQRGECEGKGRREESLYNEFGEPLQVPGQNNPELELNMAQSHALTAYLFSDTSSGYESAQHIVNQIEDACEKLRESLMLDDDQRFILHATLSDELTEAQMGKLLGMSVRQIRYKRKKSLDKVKKRLRMGGLTLNDLLVGLESNRDSAITGQAS